MAGGAVIALCADYRFILERSARLGFTEINVGLPLPMSIMGLIENSCAPHHAKTLIFGKAVKAKELMEMGLVSGIAKDRETLRKLSHRQMDYILKLPEIGFQKTRNLYRQILADKLEKFKKQDLDYYDKFFGQEEIDKILKKIIEKNQTTEKKVE